MTAMLERRAAHCTLERSHYLYTISLQAIAETSALTSVRSCVLCLMSHTEGAASYFDNGWMQRSCNEKDEKLCVCCDYIVNEFLFRFWPPMILPRLWRSLAVMPSRLSFVERYCQCSLEAAGGLRTSRSGPSSDSVVRNLASFSFFKQGLIFHGRTYRENVFSLCFLYVKLQECQSTSARPAQALQLSASDQELLHAILRHARHLEIWPSSYNS